MDGWLDGCDDWKNGRIEFELYVSKVVLKMCLSCRLRVVSVNSISGVKRSCQNQLACREIAKLAVTSKRAPVSAAIAPQIDKPQAAQVKLPSWPLRIKLRPPQSEMSEITWIQEQRNIDRPTSLSLSVHGQQVGSRSMARAANYI